MMRQNLAVRFRGTPAVYPDMRLYQEIIFLQANATCLWVVENVNPYYEPLIKPTAVLQRHLFWADFPINQLNVPKDVLRSAQIDDLENHTGISLAGVKLSNKRQALRNCVYPELGAWILSQARGRMQNNPLAADRKGRAGMSGAGAKMSSMQMDLFEKPPLTFAEMMADLADRKPTFIISEELWEELKKRKEEWSKRAYAVETHYKKGGTQGLASPH